MTNVMEKKRLFRLFAVWCFALTVVAGISAPAQAGLFGISEKEEVEAGQQVAQQAYKEYGNPLPNNHPMSRRVQAIGMRFAQLSERKNIPYSYQVLQNDKVLNAFAAPGGPIFVTTKLMNTVSNDAELAFVLGHETAHIDRKHIVKAVEKQQKVALGVGILGAIFGYGDSNTFQAISGVAFTVWSKGYSRDQESEADIYGVRWMSQLGFDPQAAISMFGKLGGAEGGISKYLSDHPQNDDRVKSAEKEIQERKLNDVARKAGGPSLSAHNLPAFKGVNADFSNDVYGMATPEDGEQLFQPVIAVQSGDYKVVMAAVGPFAEWAGGKARYDEDVYIVTRGKNSIRMRINSSQAVINGSTQSMRVVPQIVNNYLYAPVAALTEGVGGTVVWDAERHGVKVTVGRKSTFWAVRNW